MKTEDLFIFGVTPKDGPKAGKKFEVESIGRDGVLVRDEKGNHATYPHGTYKLWEPEKTLFEDDSIKPTWGNLKKAVEAKGLSDDTLIVTDPTTFDMFCLLSPRYRGGARARLIKLVNNDDKEETAIMFY